MTLSRKTIKGHVTTPGKAAVVGARVYLAPVEVLEDGTTRDIGTIYDLDGHGLMVGDDPASPAADTGLFAFTNVPPTDSDQTVPTNFALQLRTVVDGELVDETVFTLPESAPTEQWVDDLVELSSAPLTPSYPQLVNEAAAYAEAAGVSAGQAASSATDAQQALTDLEEGIAAGDFTGAPGPTGPTGPAGATGPQGATGPAGSDATVTDAAVADKVTNGSATRTAIGATYSPRYGPGTGLRPLPLADVVTTAAGANPRPIQYARGYLWGRVGTAVSRSSDMGKTWTAAFTSPVTFSAFYGTDDGQLLAMCSDQGTNGGLYKSVGWSDSTHTATSWTKVLSHSGGDADFYPFGLDGDGTKFIAAEYAETAVVFGAGRADSKKVWISQDAGSTWTTVYDTSVSEPVDNPNTHLHGVCYDRYQDRFFFVQGHSVTHGIYWSDDQGATWTKFTTLGFDPEPSPTVVRATAKGIVLGTDSEPSGAYVIPRNADPDPLLMRMQVAYKQPTGTLGLIGYAYGFAHDQTADVVYMGYRYTIGGKPSPIIASDGRVAAKVWTGPTPSGTGTAALTALAAANGKLAWFYTSPDGDFHYRASQPAFGAPALEDTGNILGGQVDRDAGSTGPGSLAIGAGAYANSVHAISISPNDAQSTANYAISIGRAVRATGVDSIAIARSSAASGADTIALGRATVASAGRSIAVGQLASAAGSDAIAIGSTATTAGGASSVAVGQSATASALRTIAVGLLPVASATDAIAVGRVASATFTAAIAIGENSTTGAANAIAIGSLSASAAGSSSVAVGTTASSAGLKSVAIGYTAVAGDASNSFGVAIGSAANATAADAVAIGRTTVTAARSVAIGQLASAGGADAVAVGSTSTSAGGSTAVAVGMSANASGTRAVAVGGSSVSSGTNTVAVGYTASASGTNAIAIGLATATNSAIAIGGGASASALGSVAIGRDSAGTGATTATADEFVIGTALHQVKTPGRLTTAASTTTQAGLVLPHGAAPTSPTNGALWTTTSGLYAQINGATQALGTSGGFVRKTADESVTSSGVLQNDDHLVLALAASTTYTFTAHLFYDGSTTGDLKVGVTVPSGATVEWGSRVVASNATTSAGSLQSQAQTAGGVGTTAGAAGVGTRQTYEMTGIVITGVTAGNLQVQWSQGVPDATATTVYTNSFLTTTARS